MSKKKGSVVSLILLLVLAVGYFASANNLSSSVDAGTIGPGYFPRILAVLLVVFCFISLVQTMKKKDEKYELPNLKYILITIGAMALYFSAWYLMGYFYIITPLFLLFLFMLFLSKDKSLKKRLIQAAIVAIGVTLFINIAFGFGLNIRF